MLSRAMAGFDKIYSLREGIIFPPWGLKFRLTNWRAGILTLYLDKETYERAGLVGKPDGVKGKRGTRPRWGKLNNHLL
jgi:ribonuclease P/MRP protein subunit RPP40